MRPRAARVGVAALSAGLIAACTAEPQRTAESDASPQRATESTPATNATPERAPVATVLFTGRIGAPNITLTTWATCPFVIERVERVRVGALRVHGYEASTGCSQQVERHIVSARLPVELKAGPGFERHVVVVSDDPAYEVEAVVRRAIA